MNCLPIFVEVTINVVEKAEEAFPVKAQDPEWKDNPEAGQQIGTSAQDLLRVYPSLVNKDKNGYYSVDYARLSIVALAAIDKLNNKIEELENKIESLERR